MRSAAGSSRTPSGTATARAIRSTGSAGPCRSAPNTSPTNNPPGSTRNSPSGTRTAKSPWLDSATRSSQHLPRQTREGPPTRHRSDRSFPSCPIPEVSRLGRTLKQWKTAILAYFDTFGASNGPTEAINGVIEPPTKSPAASATSPTTDSDAYSPPAPTAPTESNRPTMPKCEEPLNSTCGDLT